MVKIAVVFGASGGLSEAIIEKLLCDGWRVDAVSRISNKDALLARYANAVSRGQLKLYCVETRYSDFRFPVSYDVVIFTQALFDPSPIVHMDTAQIMREISVGLSDPMILTKDFLSAFPSTVGHRRDVCFIGSTSAYSGFRNTSVYCAVKHGLLGFVRALNDEYSDTDDRFWLFSMGTMRTTMGEKVQSQDPSSYLDPFDVAERIVKSLLATTNVFEPEVVMRRRFMKKL